VSAAAAVMKAGTQPQQQQQRRKALPVQSQQQQQRRSRKGPVKGFTEDCSSSPQPCTASSSSGLSQFMLLEPLSVHGVPQCAARKASSCAAGECSIMSPRAAAASCSGQAASCCGSSAINQPRSGSGTAALQAQHPTIEQLHYKQLMLSQDSTPQTAAEILAARAKSRRLRIQQRNSMGPAAFARGAVQPRPASPPPIVLDGE
jgi:hypothetical protein